GAAGGGVAGGGRPHGGPSRRSTAGALLPPRAPRLEAGRAGPDPPPRRDTTGAAPGRRAGAAPRPPHRRSPPGPGRPALPHRIGLAPGGRGGRRAAGGDVSGRIRGGRSRGGGADRRPGGSCRGARRAAFRFTPQTTPPGPAPDPLAARLRRVLPTPPPAGVSGPPFLRLLPRPGALWALPGEGWRVPGSLAARSSRAAGGGRRTGLRLGLPAPRSSRPLSQPPGRAVAGDLSRGGYRSGSLAGATATATAPARGTGRRRPGAQGGADLRRRRPPPRGIGPPLDRIRRRRRGAARGAPRASRCAGARLLSPARSADPAAARRRRSRAPPFDRPRVVQSGARRMRTGRRAGSRVRSGSAGRPGAGSRRRPPGGSGGRGGRDRRGAAGDAPRRADAGGAGGSSGGEDSGCRSGSGGGPGAVSIPDLTSGRARSALYSVQTDERKIPSVLSSAPIPWGAGMNGVAVEISTSSGVRSGAPARGTSRWNPPGRTVASRTAWRSTLTRSRTGAGR